jgi:hypothetical protein
MVGFLRKKSIIRFAFLALFAVAAFIAIAHQHDGGGHFQCGACKLSQGLSIAVITIFVAAFLCRKLAYCLPEESTLPTQHYYQALSVRSPPEAV